LHFPHKDGGVTDRRKPHNQRPIETGDYSRMILASANIKTRRASLRRSQRSDSLKDRGRAGQHMSDPNMQGCPSAAAPVLRREAGAAAPKATEAVSKVLLLRRLERSALPSLKSHLSSAIRARSDIGGSTFRGASAA
jgi:hypothetical protein